MIRIVVSSCLLGAPVRPDGGDKKSNHPILQRWIEEGRVVSLCPEMLGGLGTPRPPAEIVTADGSRRVLTLDGDDVTAAFETGAHIVANEARKDRIRVALLKNGSPSCGSSFVYDGTFRSVRVPGEGVTTALLREEGVMVFSEDEIEAADEFIATLEAGHG